MKNTKKSFDTYAALAGAVAQIKPEEIDSEMVGSLLKMLSNKAFDPIAEAIEKKVLELNVTFDAKIKAREKENALELIPPKSEPVEVWMCVRPEVRPADPNKTAFLTDEEIEDALEKYRNENPTGKTILDFSIDLTDKTKQPVKPLT